MKYKPLQYILGFTLGMDVHINQVNTSSLIKKASPASSTIWRSGASRSIGIPTSSYRLFF